MFLGIVIVLALASFFLGFLLEVDKKVYLAPDNSGYSDTDNVKNYLSDIDVFF